MRRLIWLAGLAGLVAASGAHAQASPSAFTSATRYDLMHRVTGTIAPDPDGSGPLHYAAIRNTYDIDGRLTKVEKGELSDWQSEAVLPASWPAYNASTGSGLHIFSQVDTTYDAMDRKLTDKVSGWDAGQTTLTTYAVTQYSYDPVGQLSCSVVRMNTAAFTSLPSSACTLGTARSYGDDRVIHNVYDVAGQLLQVQKAYGTSLAQNYATYTYTPNAKQASMTDANGNMASMTYDGFDRQVQWNFPSPTSAGTVSTTDYESYTYDANGNRLTLRKRDSNLITYSYDNLNRVTLKDIPGGTATDVYYGYDAWGRQTYARFGSTAGAGITNAYDTFGRLTSSSSNMDGTARTFSYAHDADGNETSITHPDGVYFGRTYDGLDREIGIYQNSSPQIVSLIYDAAGRLSYNGRWNTGIAYTYDAVSRLQTLNHNTSGYNVTWTLGYNPVSQIATQARDNDAYAYSGYSTAATSYAANGLNQYTTVGGATFGYDANGNLASNGGTTYGYDVENRLISASSGSTLEYDPRGRLWRMTASGTATEFFYDGDQLVEERDGSGNLLRRYVHGKDEDTPSIWYEGAGLSDLRSLPTDHQGSIVAVANSAGAPLAINSYDEYGVPGSGNLGRFQYTGQAYLPALGLYYYKARMYSSRLGRFLQTDPIGYKDQNNLYAYVGNDPISGTDPSGEAGFSLFGGCPAGSNCTSTDPAASNAAGSAQAAESTRNAVSPSSQNLPSGKSASPGGTDAAEITQQMAEIRAIGQDGEVEAARIVEESRNRIIATQVYVKTRIGMRVTDILARTPRGGLIGYEVKAGISPYYPKTQMRKDYLISTEGADLRSSKPIEGLYQGEHITYRTIPIYIYIVPR